MVGRRYMATETLAPRDRVFLDAYFAGKRVADCWAESNPGKTAVDPMKAGSKQLGRIRQKMGESWDDLLEVAGLTRAAFIRDLQRHLRAKIDDRPYWPARIKALRLWADMQGISSLNVNVQGELGIKVQGETPTMWGPN